MKQTLLITILLLTGFAKGYACKCNQMNLKNEIDSADLIFNGTTIEKNQIDTKMIYKFYVNKTWKGNLIDTTEIITGLAGQDCGMIFEIGKTYVVFSKNGMTSYCRKNALVDSTIIDLKLDFKFDKNYSLAFTNNDKRLTEKEADYLNRQFPDLSYNFNDKSVLFTYSTIPITKSEWIETNWNSSKPHIDFIKLTEKESQESGYDAILITWYKFNVSENVKRRILKKIK